MPLTVHGHAHGDALLKAAELALIPGDLVNDAAAVIFAGVGGMEVLLDCAAKEALGSGGTGSRLSPLRLPLLSRPQSSPRRGGAREASVAWDPHVTVGPGLLDPTQPKDLRNTCP